MNGTDPETACVDGVGKLGKQVRRIEAWASRARAASAAASSPEMGAGNPQGVPDSFSPSHRLAGGR